MRLKQIFFEKIPPLRLLTTRGERVLTQDIKDSPDRIAIVTHDIPLNTGDFSTENQFSEFFWSSHLPIL